MILRERGQNQKLAQEILEKLSPESKERLFRIFQDKENEVNAIKRKAKMTPWALM
jgi:vacuolar-type H+-ATPase subunit H